MVLGLAMQGKKFQTCALMQVTKRKVWSEYAHCFQTSDVDLGVPYLSQEAGNSGRVLEQGEHMVWGLAMKSRRSKTVSICRQLGVQVGTMSVHCLRSGDTG